MMLVMAEWLGQTGRAGALLALMLALSWLIAAPIPYTSALAADNAPPQADAGPTQAPLTEQDEEAKARQWEAEMRLHEEQASAENKQGHNAMGDQQFALAEEHFRKALELSPSPEAYLGLIDAIASQGGRDKETDKVWIAVLTQFPADRDVILFNGARLYSAGHYRAALEVAQRGLQLHPGDQQLLCYQAACYEKLGDKTQAAKSYEAALGAEYSAGAVARVASAVASASGYDAGEAVWRKYIELHPEDAKLRAYHAGANNSEPVHLDIARSELEQAIKLDPTTAEYYGELGAVCRWIKDYAASADAFSKALAISPLASYCYGRAVALDKLDQRDEALQCLRDGLALFPDDYDLNWYYGVRLIASGQAATGLKFLTDAGERLKDSTLLRMAGAQAIELHDGATAERVYGLLEADFPQYAACDVHYLAFQLAIGKQAAIVALVQSFKGTSGKYGGCSSDTFYDSGIAYLGQACRSADDTQQVFEQLIQGDPANIAIYNAYARCLLRLKRPDDALAVVRRGLNDAAKSKELAVLEAQCVVQTSGVDAALPLLKVLIEDTNADAGTYAAVIDILPVETELVRIEGLAAQGMKLFTKDTGTILYALTRAYYQAQDYQNMLRTMADPHYRDYSLFGERQTMLGRAYLHLGNYPKAIANLQEAADRMYEDQAPLHADLARAYYFLGEMNTARQEIRQAQKLQPDLASAHVWLGFVQLSAGEVEAARQAFNAVRSDLGASKEDLAWGALGRARVALLSGDQQAARIALSEAGAYAVKDSALQAEIKATRKEVQQ